MIYPNYLNDRKSLGYECPVDTECGDRLVVISDSTVLLIKNNSSKVNDRSKKIFAVVCLGVGLSLSDVKPAEAIG